MNRFDGYFLFVLGWLVVFLIIPVTHQAFFGFTSDFPIIGGFIKFFLFASIGDVVSWRLIHKNYQVKGFIYKAIIWGLIGVVIVFIFEIFTQGVMAAQANGLLPFEGSVLARAFFISLFMNFTFAPTMMLFHRLSDGYIELKVNRVNNAFNQVINSTDYRGFITFVVFKTIPLFWLPAHTITFILPLEYRVFFASLLGVALGLILGLAKTVKSKEA